MAVRGVYTKQEEKIIAKWRERADRTAGWKGKEPSLEVPYPVFHRVVTEDLMLNWAIAVDYFNPLWRDENYARNTRWGGLIAAPFYEYVVSHANVPVVLPEEYVGFGITYMLWTGTKWQFFEPTRLNDSFRVWVCPFVIKDVTPLDGKGPRTMLFTAEQRFINQKDELVAVHSWDILSVTVHESTGEKSSHHPSMPRQTEYRYTKEELEFIGRIYREEEIRGAKILYWEDVNVGEDLKPVANGPITLWDEMLLFQGLGVLTFPIREVCKKTPERVVVDPVTGVSHKTMEQHIIDRVAEIEGRPYAIVIPMRIDVILGRLITNWMGDDGFLKKYSVHVRTGLRVGDTVFVRGKVVKKYVENDEHLIDLVVWLENIKGNINHIATATVSLLSKGKPWMQVVRRK